MFAQSNDCDANLLRTENINDFISQNEHIGIVYHGFLSKEIEFGNVDRVFSCGYLS